LPDGGWPASLGLLVPGQRSPATEIFADDRRLLSTAMAVQALVDAATPRPTTTDKTASAVAQVGSSSAIHADVLPADE
jgi:hypothetical protein